MTINWHRYALDPAFRNGVDDVRAEDKATAISVSRNTTSIDNSLESIPSGQIVSVECPFVSPKRIDFYARP